MCVQLLVAREPGSPALSNACIHLDQQARIHACMHNHRDSRHVCMQSCIRKNTRAQTHTHTYIHTHPPTPTHSVTQLTHAPAARGLVQQENRQVLSLHLQFGFLIAGICPDTRPPVCACVCACACACACACVSARMRVHVCECAGVRVCVRASSTDESMCAHVYVSVCVCVYIYTYTHT